MMNVKFYVCPICGNKVEMIHGSGVPVMCCGQKMVELVPNTVEASGEKHIPVASVDGDLVKVNVGSVDHPMADVHYIEWVALVTENGVQRKHLQPGEAPAVSFRLNGEKPVAVYAYCNLHGLWMSQLN